MSKLVFVVAVVLFLQVVSWTVARPEEATQKPDPKKIIDDALASLQNMFKNVEGTDFYKNISSSMAELTNAIQQQGQKWIKTLDEATRND